jgi:predicted RNA-binding Zn-ribbon protein involved in translation (DUF1610 family)
MLAFFEIVLWIFIALPLLLLVLFLVVAIIGAIYGPIASRANMEFAFTLPCPSCGKVIGKEAVLATQALCATRVQQWIKENPGLRCMIWRRWIARWEIRCPHCGYEFYFSPSSRKIEVIVVKKPQP